jgi:hypothetical protein
MRIVYTGVGLGIVLVGLAMLSEKKDLKKHFSFTYSNFGIHLFFISGLAGLFIQDRYSLLWFLILLAAAWYFSREAFRQKSFYFVLIITLYTYIALSDVGVRFLWRMAPGNIDEVYLILVYFILSAIALIRVLIILNRKMKAHDRIQ